MKGSSADVARVPPSPIEIKPGDVIGKLTVRGRASDGLRVWICECACGEVVFRATSSLRHAVAHRTISACTVCRESSRIVATRNYYRRRAYATTRSLWSDNAVYLLQRRVLNDLVEEYGLPRSGLPKQMYGVASGARETIPDVQQRLADLYPIGGNDDRTWQCAHCDKVVPRGFGCVECLDFVCIECVRAEQHKHPDGTFTLAEIGDHLGVSRERIRQMEGRALRTLRHPSRLRYFEARDVLISSDVGRSGTKSRFASSPLPRRRHLAKLFNVVAPNRSEL